MIEKRIEKRSAIQLAASYGIEEDLRPEREARINNISSGGFCFTSDNKPRVGEKFQLAVDLDTIEEIVVTVKVVWVKSARNNGKYTVGVQIIEKDDPGFERFIEFYNSVK